MEQVNIHEAKTHLSQLIHRTLAGEKIIIAKSGVPLVELSPYTETHFKRQGGQLKGLIYIAEDFDAPLPADVLQAFYGDET